MYTKSARRHLILSTLLTTGTVFAAPPTSGPYVTDPQNEWVQDQSTEAIATANQLLCFMASTRADAMVNQGGFVAFIDEAKCDSSRGDANASTSSSGGSSVSYTRMHLTSTRADNNSPQIVKGHAEVRNDDGDVMPTYFYAEASAAPSSAAPNGEMILRYASVDPSTNGQFFKGYVSASGQSVSFAESGDWGGSVEETKMYLNTSGDSGAGAVQAPVWTNGSVTSVNFRFGYNANYFCRTNGVNEHCFSRSRANAKKSTWRYGVYNQDGSRFEAGQPGFNIINSAGEYGWAGYWGIWMPTALSDGDTVKDKQDNSYTVHKTSGRLTKHTRASITLAAMDKLPFRLWMQDVTGATSDWLEYQLNWNEAQAKFVVTHKNACDSNGCYLTKLGTPVNLTPSDMNSKTNNWGINAWSEALGAQISIPSSVVASGSGSVTYHSQETVKPGDATVPASLRCVRDCMTFNTLSAFNGNNSPYTTNTQNRWGDTPQGDTVAYTWNGATYELNDGSGVVGLAAINSNLTDWQSYKWGIRTGALIDASDLTDITCNSNKYCEHKVTDGSAGIDTYYIWETGPQDWNTASFLRSSTGYVSFTAPLRAEYVVPTGAAYGEFAGTTMYLQYQGFGELHGIPGKCFASDTNEETSCGPNTRWVPAFAIADGATVVIGGETKYVKGLESEIRFAKVNDSAQNLGITLGSLSDLPAGVSLNDASDATDPSNASNTSFYPGGYGDVDFDAAPAVIHGVVQ